MTTCGSMPSIGAESSHGDASTIDPADAVVEVAVGVVVNDAGDVLVTRRHDDSHQGGLWEFPGGKREAYETTSEALDRELREELAISVVESEPLIVIDHDYGDKRVRLDVRQVSRFAGTPTPQEGQPMRWVAVADLKTLEFPAANAAIVKCLDTQAAR